MFSHLRAVLVHFNCVVIASVYARVKQWKLQSSLSRLVCEMQYVCTTLWQTPPPSAPILRCIQTHKCDSRPCGPMLKVLAALIRMHIAQEHPKCIYSAKIRHFTTNSTNTRCPTGGTPNETCTAVFVERQRQRGVTGIERMS